MQGRSMGAGRRGVEERFEMPGIVQAAGTELLFTDDDRDGGPVCCELRPKPQGSSAAAEEEEAVVSTENSGHERADCV
uniref:Uncharacterized protein n=1 Tax=Knipowitschia caucasica TaxID=637954 RepID=A0AAV2LYG7_KNICA